MKKAFDILKGWTTNFGDNTGRLDLCNDERLLWHLQNVEGKTVLELGPLEGAHTKTMEEKGFHVTAIEGNENNFLKCLIVKNEFNLKAKFIYADFCEWIKNTSLRFDIVSAAGVLYHQQNPADLIFELARITDTVIVWSQVASSKIPSGSEHEVSGYKGKVNYYGTKSDSYCGGLNKTSFWMYPKEMIRCLKDAGFKNIIQKYCEPNVNGDCLLFVAKK